MEAFSQIKAPVCIRSPKPPSWAVFPAVKILSQEKILLAQVMEMLAKVSKRIAFQGRHFNKSSKVLIEF